MKSNRGGRRPGAGRPRKMLVPVSAEGLADFEAAKRVLREIATHGESENARVSAAKALAAVTAPPSAARGGKKEAAKLAADDAAVGAYATRPAPQMAVDEAETLQ